jgi:hypothetical protein
LPGTPGVALWTDDFSNILKVFTWRPFNLGEALDPGHSRQTPKS